MRYDSLLKLSESIINRHVGGFTFFSGVTVDANDSESKRFPLAYLIPLPANDEASTSGTRIAYNLTFFLVDVLSSDRLDSEVNDTVAQYHTACTDIVDEFRRIGEQESEFNGEVLDFRISVEAVYLPIIDSGSTNMTGCQVTFTITDSIERNYCANDRFAEALSVNELNQLIVDDRGNAIAVSDETISKVIECLPVTITDSDGTTIVEVPSGGSFECTVIVCDKDLFLKGIFASGSDTMETITIDADNAGTYVSITDDGSSGSITLDINGGGDAAFINPTVLAVSDTVVAKRTVSTAAGFYKITGTHA